MESLRASVRAHHSRLAAWTHLSCSLLTPGEQQLKKLFTHQRLPSTTAKLLNPMASSLRLTTSNNSDTFQKDQAMSGGSVRVQAFSGNTFSWSFWISAAM